MGNFWVFGYGSLMWRPGFDHCSVQKARVFGFHRALCVHSYVHRGTPEKPGLVLGLDRGGSCLGLAFEVSEDDGEAVLAYLRARELVTNVYLERSASVELADGRRTKAIAYVVDRRHEQYARRMDSKSAAEIVAGAEGQSGVNPDYVLSTLAHLRELGIRDRWLEDVGRRLTIAAA
jgi:cation transport protein ChaC